MPYDPNARWPADAQLTGTPLSPERAAKLSEAIGLLELVAADLLRAAGRDRDAERVTTDQFKLGEDLVNEVSAVRDSGADADHYVWATQSLLVDIAGLREVLTGVAGIGFIDLTLGNVASTLQIAERHGAPTARVALTCSYLSRGHDLLEAVSEASAAAAELG